MQLPAFMLKQFYRSESLRNEGDGFRFALTNPVMPATIVEILEVSVAGNAYSLDELAFAQDGTMRAAASVASSAPVEFPKGSVVTVIIKGQPLPAGRHPISVKVRTEQFGSLSVEVEDSIRSE